MLAAAVGTSVSLEAGRTVPVAEGTVEVRRAAFDLPHPYDNTTHNKMVMGTIGCLK
jgi:hypothetical protein